MSLGSSGERGLTAQAARVRSGWWVLAAMPVLCVLSYPLAVLGPATPMGTAAASFSLLGWVALAARRAGQHRVALGLGLTVAIWVNVLVGGLAWLGDGAEERVVVDLLVLVNVGMLFAGHFVCWLMADAVPEAVPAPAGFEPFHARGRPLLSGKTGLAVVMMLGLLAFGLGAAWSRAETWVPGPAPWVVVFTMLCFALMLAERVRRLGRWAREGNLVLVARAREKWLAAAALGLVAAALAAALVPWRGPEPELQPIQAGTRMEEAPAPGTLESLASTARMSAQSAAAVVGAAYARAPRLILSLWLLLLFLLVVAALIWFSARARAAQHLLRWVMAALGWVGERWRRLWAWLGRWVRRQARSRADEPRSLLAQDPFYDVFRDPEVLARLSAREVAIHTYHLLLNLAEMLGHGRRTGQTALEYGARLAEVAAGAEEAVATLTWAYAAAMYGDPQAVLPAPVTLRQAWERVSQVLRVRYGKEEFARREQAYRAARARRR